MGLESVTVHIGPQKTATKFIQQCLAALRPELRSRGIALVNRAEMVRLDNFGYWGAFNRSAPDRAALFQKELREAIDNRVNALRGRKRVLLMSNESFVGVPQPEYRDWPRAEAALEQAFAAFDCDDIRLVAYPRRQDTWIESMYMQRIHAGKSFSFEWFLRQRMKDPAISYTSLFDRLTAMPRVTSLQVRPFEMIRGGGERIMSHVLDQVGCADLAAIANEIPPANTGYSEAAWQAALAANRYADGKGSAERSRIRKALRKAFPVPEYPKPQLLDDSTRAEILALYRRDNEELFRRFMRDLPADSYSSVAATQRLAAL